VLLRNRERWRGRAGSLQRTDPPICGGASRCDPRYAGEVSQWAQTFHHKSLARSIGAIASLAGALSVLIGVVVTHMAPHGWGRVTMALHLT
jgi:hypothetical protein